MTKAKTLLAHGRCPSRRDIESYDLHGTGELGDHLENCSICRQWYRLVSNLRRFSLMPAMVLDGKAPSSWHVYIDESGTNSPRFDDERYPSLTLAAVITTPEKLSAIDEVRAGVVSRAGLDPSTEIHASPCIHNQEAFKGLSAQSREAILWQFVEENRDNYLFFYAPDMLKKMVKKEIREGLAERDLTQYSALFLYLLATVGKFVEHVLHGRFEIFLDRNPAVIADLLRGAEYLRQHKNERLRLNALRGELKALESHESAAVQLADVIAHYAGRYHRIEVQKFDHGDALGRFSEKIETFYRALLRPKDLPWLIPEVYMNLDLKALEQVDVGRFSARP